ncbi:MAG: hypothetical protein ACFFDF_04610 [Candidatus Odinarchaeota archaeon]
MDIIEIKSSRIKFEDLLLLIDKAINSGEGIHIKRSMLGQHNTTITFLKWAEKHKIVSLIPIEIQTPKTKSVRSRMRKIEISLQLLALDLSLNGIAKKFNVRLNTAQGYLKNANLISDQYLQVLRTILKLKGINLNTKLHDYPSFPIMIPMKDLKENLKQNEYDELQKIVDDNKYIKKVTGQKLGTINLSVLLP